MSDEYELLPAEELAQLRREVELLKTNPLGEGKEAKTLQHSVDHLAESINKLIKVFANIDDELVNDAASLEGARNHFDELKAQNRNLAADIEEMKKILLAGQHSTPAANTFQAPPVNEQARPQQTNLPPTEEIASTPPDKEDHKWRLRL